MLAKFYVVKNKEDIYAGEKYIFELNMEVIPRAGELIWTEEKAYRVIDVCHVLEYNKEFNFVCKQADITVMEWEVS